LSLGLIARRVRTLFRNLGERHAPTDIDSANMSAALNNEMLAQ
jgi:hypothetical protein